MSGVVDLLALDLPAEGLVATSENGTDWEWVGEPYSMADLVVVGFPGGPMALWKRGTGPDGSTWTPCTHPATAFPTFRKEYRGTFRKDEP